VDFRRGPRHDRPVGTGAQPVAGSGIPSSWIARRWSTDTDESATRLRGGQLAAVLFAVAAVYHLVLMPQMTPQLGDQVLLVLLVAATGVVVAVLPWGRWPASRLAAAPILGIVLLSGGEGAWLGQLAHYSPLYGLIFGFTGLVLPPGWTIRLTGLALAGLGVATVLGHQHDYLVVLIGTILIAALMSELMAAGMDLQRHHRANLTRLHQGLTRLLAAPDEAHAAAVIAQLGGDLLGCDGVTVVTRQTPGSAIMVGRGGHGLGSPRFSTIRIDINREQSGAGVVARTGQPLFVPDAASSPFVAHPLAEIFSIASALYLPIIGPDETIGAIVLWWSTPITRPDGFAEQVIQLLSIQAAQVLHRLRQVDHLDRAALTDPLTAVGNRRAFDQALADLPDNAAVILLDLDHFKALNDTQGHPAGDRVLRAFAAAAASCVRDGDLVARIGGDEFAILMPGGQQAIDTVLLRLRLAWVTPDGVGFSAGTAVRHPGEDGQHFCQRADQALYAAKRASTPCTDAGSAIRPQATCPEDSMSARHDP
jgi:diguanylate cyclase (GGDEF)-like protein